MIVIEPDTALAEWVVGMAIATYLLLISGGLWWAARRGHARRSLRVAYWVLVLYGSNWSALPRSSNSADSGLLWALRGWSGCLHWP